MKSSKIYGEYHEVLLAQIKQGFAHVVVLAYPCIDIQETDSITLMSLIRLRDIAEKNNLSFSITSEMLDVNNRENYKNCKKYDDAMSKGDGAYLLDENRPNMFTLSVGNLNPGRSAIITPLFLNSNNHHGTLT